MDGNSAHIRKLAEKFGASLVLHKLYVDLNLWRLHYLQNVLDALLYEEMALYAELGFVTFPDRTYWNAELTPLGRQVFECWVRDVFGKTSGSTTQLKTAQEICREEEPSP